MNDIQLQSIQERLKTIHGFWENCTILVQDLKQLSKHSSGGGMPEELLFLERVKLIIHHRLVLEISKIFSKSPMQDKSIHQLLNKIEKYNKENPTKKISLSLEEITSTLNSTLKETIEINDRIRNKLVAHHDPENFKLKVEISYDKIEEMLNHIKNFLDMSYPVLLNSNTPEIENVTGASQVIELVLKDQGVL